MNVKDVFLEWVFPLLGGIVGTLMFMAPLKAVLEGTRRRNAALTTSPA
jgi:glycerol uptake facilitator-like aquaporin